MKLTNSRTDVPESSDPIAAGRGRKGEAKRSAITYNCESRCAMFEAIKALIPNLLEGTKPRTAAKGHSSWLATAGLLRAWQPFTTRCLRGGGKSFTHY